MTCIVGLLDKNKIFIGGDSAGVNSDYSLTIRKDEKVFQNGEFLFGGTSSFRMLNLLRYSFKPPKQKAGITDEVYIHTAFIDSIRSCFKSGGYTSVKESVENGGCFIFGFHGQLFEVEEDFQISQSVDNFMACGCGAQIALGSLYSTQDLELQERVRIALEAAEHHSAGVRSPFIIKSI